MNDSPDGHALGGENRGRPCRRPLAWGGNCLFDVPEDAAAAECWPRALGDIAITYGGLGCRSGDLCNAGSQPGQAALCPGIRRRQTRKSPEGLEPPPESCQRTTRPGKSQVSAGMQVSRAVGISADRRDGPQLALFGLGGGPSTPESSTCRPLSGPPVSLPHPLRGLLVFVTDGVIPALPSHRLAS